MQETIISQHPANRGARLTPKTSAILTSCAGGAIYGLSAGIIGGIQDAVVKDRYFSHEASSVQASLSGLLTASLLLGAFVGCFLGVDFGNRFGRRVAFRITGAIAVVMSVLLAVVPSFAALVLLRTALGLAVGLATALCPWYVTDAIPVNIRGSIGTIFQINICAFILVAEIINFAFHPNASETHVHIDEWKWRLQLAFSAIPGLALLILSFIMHESPAYLQSLADQERLVNFGSSSSGSGANGANGHMSAVVVASDDMGRSTPSYPDAPPEKQGWGVLFSRENLRWVAVGLILSSSNQLTGINAIIFYAPGIFKDAEMANPLVLTIAVVGTWNLLSVFISFALVDRLGRRTLMLSALALMAAGTGLMALAYAAFPDHKAPAAITALLLFIGAFECGPGPLFFLMAVESFPPALRDPALSMTQASGWVFSIVITFGFPVLNDAIGSAGTFLIFFINCVLSVWFIWWMVPEPAAEGGADSTAAATDDATRGRTNSIGANTSAYQKL